MERIVDKRRNKKGKWEYLIRWKGYGSKEDTWEPEHHLLHCEEFIDQFNSLGLHSHKTKVPKSRQETLIPRYPSAAETSRARSESRKKRRTCDPAVGVRVGDVLGMGSGGSGPTQKQRKVGIGPGRHDLGLGKAMTYKASSHGGSHFSPASAVPHNGLQNGELEPLVYRTAARSHRLPLDRGEGEQGEMDTTGQQLKKRGKILNKMNTGLELDITLRLIRALNYPCRSQSRAAQQYLLIITDVFVCPDL